MLIPALKASAQQPPAWHDDLADKLEGHWKPVGMVMGRAANHEVTAQWVLAHHFLEIHERTAASAPAFESKYDAIWFLGCDDLTGHYVLHLMDLFGGRYSETLGNGIRSDQEMQFLFDYPDGPFYTNWRWLPDEKTWKLHMERKTKSGKWETFGDFRMTRE